MTLTGIDISSYQGNVSLTGYSFVICRAGFGTTQDLAYGSHSLAVRNAGLPLGAYWFWYLGQDNAKAVALFLSVAGGADFLVLDLEGNGARSATGEDQARDFINRVHAAGRQIGLYSSASGFPDVGQDWNWIASWGSTPPTHQWTFWQYSGIGLDHDKFNGDAAALAAFLQENEMGLTLSLPDPVAVGTLAIAAGVNVLRISDGSQHANLHAQSGLPAYGMTLLANGAAAGGYVFDQPDGTAYFVRRSDCSFVAAPSGFSQAQVDAAVLAGKQAQYDLDAKSIAVSAKLSDPRP